MIVPGAPEGDGFREIAQGRQRPPEFPASRAISGELAAVNVRAVAEKAESLDLLRGDLLPDFIELGR